MVQKVNALIKLEIMFLQLLPAAVEDTLMWASGLWIDSVNIYLFISLNDKVNFYSIKQQYHVWWDTKWNITSGTAS